MATTKYLDQDGVELLVQTFDNKIDIKADKSALAAKADKSQLANYATKEELANIDVDLDGYVTTDDLAGLATEVYVNNAVSNIDLSNYATESYVDGLIQHIPAPYDDRELASRVTTLEGRTTGLYHFKGSVANLAALQAVVDPEVGDTYNLADTGMNAAWTGTEWDEFGSVQDLSEYAKKEDVATLSRAEINAILFGGKTAVVNNVESFSAVLASNQPKVEVTLNNDIALTEPLTVPAGKEITLNLNGSDITAGSGQAALVASGANSKLILTGTGTISGSNPEESTVQARQGAEVVVNGVTITNSADCGVSSTGAGSKVTIESGAITAKEYGVIVTSGGNVDINGGTIQGIDNFALGGNGSPGKAAGTVNINGGTLEGHITSDGYMATAIYWPNEGTLNIYGGTIITDGAGIVQRGGTVNIGSGAVIMPSENPVAITEGKAGDSRQVVGRYAVVYDYNSKYPAYQTMQLNIADGAQLSGHDGVLQVLPSDAPGITDNRS